MARWGFPAGFFHFSLLVMLHWQCSTAQRACVLLDQSRSGMDSQDAAAWLGYYSFGFLD